MKATQKIIAALIASALLVILAVAASFWAFEQLEVAAAARKQAFTVIVRANALLSELRDAEIGQRGYSLTGDETTLQPYAAVRDHISDHLTTLHTLATTAAAEKLLDVLDPLVKVKLATLAQAIELRRKNDMPAVVALTATGLDKRLMDAIRANIGGFVALEETALEGHEAAVKSNMRRMYIIIVAASLLTLLFALSFGYFVYREHRHRLNELVHVETQHLLKSQDDIHTRLQKTYAALQVTEERLAVTLNSIGDAVIATDGEGHITLMNPLAERLTGWTRIESFGQPVDKIFHIISETTRQPSLVPVKATLLHGTVQGLANHTILVSRNGDECSIADSCAPIRDREGEVVGAVLVFRDVSIVRRTDHELEVRNAELQAAKLLAEKANRAKSDFLSSMSHELRTPLGAILGFAQLIESGVPKPTPVQKRSVDQILQAGWYLLDLINEILDLALIESGKLSLSLEPSSLPEVLRECQTMIESQAKKRGVSVTFPKFDTPCFVNADRTRIKQVMINLLSNAIKYNKAGGKVVIDCVIDATEHVRISVKDTGTGLSPHQLSQLFQPFNRLGQETTAEEGTGIGLVVSKQLIELMRGTIGVESTVGEGSTFWFELPLTKGPRVSLDAPAADSIAKPRADLFQQMRSLLYVEDNPANLMLIEDLMLRRPDIQLLIATDGIAGVDLARSANPDVILMDINLPGISGIEALKILLADPTTAHIPIIALSANAMPRDIEKGLEAGFFRYLTKPIKVIEFMETLDLALKHADETSPRINTEKRT